MGSFTQSDKEKQNMFSRYFFGVCVCFCFPTEKLNTESDSNTWDSYWFGIIHITAVFTIITVDGEIVGLGRWQLARCLWH